MALVYVATCGGVVDTVIVSVKLFPGKIIISYLFSLSLPFLFPPFRSDGCSRRKFSRGETWLADPWNLAVTELTVGNVSRASWTVRRSASQRDRPVRLVASAYVKEPIRGRHHDRERTDLSFFERFSGRNFSTNNTNNTIFRRDWKNLKCRNRIRYHDVKKAKRRVRKRKGHVLEITRGMFRWNVR